MPSLPTTDAISRPYLAIGRRLRDARIRAGYPDQPMAARALGVALNTVNRHECGTNLPNKQMFAKYAHFYRVDEAELVYGPREEAPPPAVFDFLMRPEGRVLPDEVKSRLVQVSWSVLAPGLVDVAIVAAVARLIDANLGRPRNSPDALSRPGRGVPEGATRARAS